MRPVPAVLNYSKIDYSKLPQRTRPCASRRRRSARRVPHPVAPKTFDLRRLAGSATPSATLHNLLRNPLGNGRCG